MENVLCSFLNTSLPLPCRTLNSQSDSHPMSKTSFTDLSMATKPVPKSGLSTGAELVRRTSAAAGSKEQPPVVSSLVEVMTGAASDLLDGVTCESHSELPETTPTQPSHSSMTSSPSGSSLECGARGGDTASANPNQTRPLHKPPPLTYFHTIKTHISRLFHLLCTYITAARAILTHYLSPTSQDTLLSLSKDQQLLHPLSNTLLALGTEASTLHCRELWATDTATQLSLLTLVGGAMDRFLMQELKTVVYEERNWVRALYHLRHALWVEGHQELDRSSREKLSVEEQRLRKKAAADAFKKFLPSNSLDLSHYVAVCVCVRAPQFFLFLSFLFSFLLSLALLPSYSPSHPLFLPFFPPSLLLPSLPFFLPLSPSLTSFLLFQSPLLPSLPFFPSLPLSLLSFSFNLVSEQTSDN